MPLALAQVGTGWNIPNTTFSKSSLAKFGTSAGAAFPAGDSSYYPGLQESSSPLERDVEKHSTATKLQRKSHLVLSCGWDQMWEGLPSYLVPEGPREQSVVVSLHDNEEQGQVGPFPCPIPVQVHPQTHLIAIFCSVES